jgi:Cdc6-like AAA superfamily ATPase
VKKNKSHNNFNLSKGYDAPPSTKEEDLLNRWGFAREIYTVASRTPLDWSVRIGIYGSWGEGKTAILKFVNTIAREDNQIVVWFNPWEYATPEEMWESFVALILKKLSEAGVEIKKPSRQFLRAKILFKKILRKPFDVFGSLAQLDPYASVGLPVLKSFLSFNRKSLTKLQNFISGKRIIVLIDDLDRANPILVPQLLFAVKELLDLPSMVFVLAFDPNVVNDVLYSDRNDKGKDYLDKIIDFPKWLPKLDDKDLLRLLQVESGKHLPFLDFNYIQQVFPYLAKNPRKLKQWLRLFVGFEDEIKRYNKEEINWTVFLLVNLIKIEFPNIFDLIFGNKDIWDDLFTSRWFGETRRRPNNLYSTSSDGSDNDPIYKQKIKEISAVANLSNQEQVRLLSIIEEIVKLDNPFTSESFLSYAYLTERPSVLTWKEFNEVLLNYENNTTLDELNSLLNPLIQKSNYEEFEILRAFLLKAIDYWTWSLGQASDARAGEGTKSHTNDAILSLNLIEKICFDKNGFVGINPFLDFSHFSSIYNTATKWINFTMPEDVYLPIREKEKQLLIRICNETTSDLIEILFFLKPWNVFRDVVFNQQEEKMLANELSLILEKRISVQLLDKFKIDNWVNSIFVQESHLVEQYILFRKSSYFWSSELRRKFLELLCNKESQKAMTNNMYQFLSLIDAAFFSQGSINGIIRFEDSILQDKELIIEIWNCAFREEINPRMFRGAEELKNELKKRCDIDVPPPSWWKRIKQLVEGSAQQEQG